MIQTKRVRLGQGGFTLAEMLVAMALLAILAAVVLPSILNQVRKGEASRTVSDLNSVAAAVRTFNADVQRWPISLGQLVAQPTSTAATLNGTMTPTLAARWSGPYLERGEIDGDGIQTGFGAVISNTLSEETWNNNPFLVITASPISAAQAEQVSTAVDGDNSLGTGRIRHTGTTLSFYAVPIN